MHSKAAVYVAATRQHVGKTSTCLGLLQGLTNRCKRIGFLKPVGQQSVVLENNLRVDKDVVVAKGTSKVQAIKTLHHHIFLEIFGLPTCEYRDMSPIVIPPGYTKQYLDGKITLETQLHQIKKSFTCIAEKNDVIHCFRLTFNFSDRISF